MRKPSFLLLPSATPYRLASTEKLQLDIFVVMDRECAASSPTLIHALVELRPPVKDPRKREIK
jgi:hypothetical protein